MTIKFYYNGNTTTRKFPRTLAEAFPENPQPNFDNGIDAEDKLVIIGSVVILTILFALTIGGLV